MSKKMILIVPPRGTRVKAIRIRLSVAILFFVVFIGGFAGYFIPFNSFTLDIAEQNQQKNLADQNKNLLQRILATLKLLNNLKDQVRKLEAKRTHIEALAGIDIDTAARRRKPLNFAEMSPDALLRFVEQRYSLISSLAADVTPGKNLFERIPVNKPVAGNAPVTRRFGPGKDPFTGKKKFHYGIDFAAEPETPVIAPANGTVSRIENHPVWGKRIHISHGGLFVTIYAHLGSVRVGQGKLVKRGEIIGTIGLSGLTTGPHLHYEIWRDGRAVDPDEYFFPLDALAYRE